MGAEGYGLIGFFVMLQACLALLDLGLSPTISRETARFLTCAIDAASYRRVLFALELFFVFVALTGGVLIFISADYIAKSWLQISVLTDAEVQTSVKLMALIFSIRWMCGLYRGVISGSENLVWLGSYNALIGTFHFVFVVPLLIFWGGTPTLFFTYQLIVTVIELLGLVLFSYKIVPSVKLALRAPFEFKSTKQILKFSLNIALTSSIWVFATQIDKLILSKSLPLADFGYFTLAILVAGGINIITSPVSMAIMPRMTRLVALGDNDGVIRIYRKLTQLVSIFASSAVVTIIFCAKPFLLAWTGNEVLVQKVEPVLILYALGNSIVAISAFPYYLQYAKGDLRLHLIGSMIFVLLLVPATILAAKNYGSLGTGYVWLTVNLILFTVWLPVIHKRFSPGLNAKWYFKDTVPIYLFVFSSGYILSIFTSFGYGRFYDFALVFVFGLVMLIAAGVASSEMRSVCRKLFLRRLIL
jgi:O-antigen/teichoic acid export membrane protein